MGDVKRKFATILATDCVGFSKHMLEDEQATFESLNACREIIDALIEQHGAKKPGDGGKPGGFGGGKKGPIRMWKGKAYFVDDKENWM